MDNQVLLTDTNTTGKVLDHLGIVMSTIDKLGIVDKIDSHLPVSAEKGALTTMGQRVAAMILNGLGFMDDRLYMFPDFLENKPVSRLLGDDLDAKYFNDDALGRCLDAIYDHGVDKLFSELAFTIGKEQGLLGGSAHFDTTSLTLHGSYDRYQENIDIEKTIQSTQPADKIDNIKNTGVEGEEQNNNERNPPVLTHGFSKDHRPDLKQIVLNLATTGAAGFPIWMEPHSGNASDQKELRAAAERMQNFCKELKNAPSFIYVADSAMYQSCISDDCSLVWLSRVPERLKWVKELLQHSDESYVWQQLENGYKFCIVETKFKDVQQRLCIVASEQAYHREIKTFDRLLQKQLDEHKKKLWHLGNQQFGCPEDAIAALKSLNKKMKYHQVSAEIEPVLKYNGKGRPKKGEVASVVGYKIVGSIVEQADLIEKTRRQKGRFMLATNELDRSVMPDDQLLKEYKEQSKTESGFRFIKDDTFEVSSVFLKKPSRIAALLMIMTLCLMVYSVAQYHLRESLNEVNLEDFDPENKLTKKPTMKRVFKLFNGIQELTVKLENYTQCLIINMTDLVKKIIRCFGDKAMIIYALSG